MILFCELSKTRRIGEKYNKIQHNIFYFIYLITGTEPNILCKLVKLINVLINV